MRIDICFGIANGHILSIFDRLIYLPATHLFSFPDDNINKYQWILTKLGKYIDNVEICFGIANGNVSSILTMLSAPITSVF